MGVDINSRVGKRRYGYEEVQYMKAMAMELEIKTGSM